ncbi:MAG: ketoacyl-ACP synthase III [Actinomycetota bacterium]|nr:ketoacyl-ACP synthase III [Actinomycetota bacterium]
MKEIKNMSRPKGSRVSGIGVYRPKRKVTNEEIAPLIDSSDKWIRERSGIIQRRYASVEETVAAMAIAACEEALKDSKISSTDIDLVILATATNPAQLPNLAMEIATKIGATKAGAYDIGAACSGFSYGLSIASQAVLSGECRNVLIVGSERMTDFVSEKDRGTAFLFADGAGAFVVSPSEKTEISAPTWGADGNLNDWICMTKDWPTYMNEKDGDFPALKMEGQKVFRWAITEMVGVAHKTLEKAGIGVDDLGAFVPHQANQRITDHIAKSLNLPPHVAIARDGVNMGNTTAATIPLALDTLRRNGEVKSGDLALLMGFGAGLAYSGQVIVVP